MNGKDFRGINLRYIASRSLYHWRADLARTRKESEEPVLTERWEEADKKVLTPTRVDQFFQRLFSEITKSPESARSTSAKTLETLLKTNNVKSYIELANLFYGGNMMKTYLNLSSVAQMTGQKLPDKWQAFNGSTTEFREQTRWVRENPQTTIIDFKNKFNLKSEKVARLNLAAIRNMNGLPKGS